MPLTRRLGALLGLSATAVVASATPAPAATINAGALTVSAYSASGFQASYGGASAFDGSYATGFLVRFADGPLSGQALGNGLGANRSWTPVSDDAPVRDGSTQTGETVYVARNGTTDVARVRQTVRATDDAHTFRVTYRLENLTGAPLRFRASALGALTPAGDYSVTGGNRPGPPRVIGGHGDYSGAFVGLEEVRSSQLPGESAPVPVPAWSAGRLGYEWTVASELGSDAGPLDSVQTTSQYAPAAVGSWSDHLAADDGLAAGATARYEVVWHVGSVAPISLTGRGSAYVGGRPAKVDVRLTAGAVANTELRWRATGTNSASGTVTTDADGAAHLEYAGTQTGSDRVTVWRDLDGDGQLGGDEPRRGMGVSWSSLPPQISVYRWSWDGSRVGTAQSFGVGVRDRFGDVLAGAHVRWRQSGANDATGATTSDAFGSATLTLSARHAGDDSLLVWTDRDDDGVRDDDEPSTTQSLTWAPPPPRVDLTAWEASPRATSSSTTQVRISDEFGVRSGATDVLWSVTGANPRPVTALRTDATGSATVSYTGANAGTDTLTVGHDLDGDGALGAGEPVGTRTITWRQAPPPAPTSETLSTDRISAKISSDGGIAATLDGSDALVNDRYGFQLRILDGPLAGHVYARGGSDWGGAEAFYSDPQTAATRDGDTVTQRSSWRVRADDRDVLRVRQVVRATDASDGLRVTWRVENLTGTAIRLRAGDTGDVSIDGHSTGDLYTTGGAHRFIGIEGAAGMVAGAEQVTSSRLPEDAAPVPVPGFDRTGVGDAYYVDQWITMTSSVESSYRSAVGVGWDDHAGTDAGLGASAEARYELIWRLRRPVPLFLTPARDTVETRTTHRTTATLLDEAGHARADVSLRWEVKGAHPATGVATTDDGGHAVISTTARTPGRDTLTVYADGDGDGERGAQEPQRDAIVDWRTETAVDPPRFAPLVTPGGTTIAPNLQEVGLDRFLKITPSEAARFPRCANGSAKVDLGVSVNINAAAGTIVPGSAALLTVDPVTGDLEHPLASAAATSIAADGTASFVLECLPNASLSVCYELQEGDLHERFCVSLGGIGLWDPSGRVYDAARSRVLADAGCTPALARRLSALDGAQAVLERRYPSGFRRVLSGDPFISPNVNPFVTEADGRFGWNVAPGTYRVVASHAGYAGATSDEATVPPAVSGLDVGLEPDVAPAARTDAEQIADRVLCAMVPAEETPVAGDGLLQGGTVGKGEFNAKPVGTPGPPVTVVFPTIPGTSQTGGQVTQDQGTSTSSAQWWSTYAPTTFPYWAPIWPAPVFRRTTSAKQSPASKPAVSVIARAMRVDRKGRLRVKLFCPPLLGRRTCDGQLEAVVPGASTVLARAGYSVSSGGKGTATLRLGRRARAAAVRRVVVQGTQRGQRFVLGVAAIVR